MNPALNSILVEARARLVWGDPVFAIVEYMTAQGLTAEEIRFILGGLIRKRCRQLLWTGIPLFLTGSIIMVFLVTYRLTEGYSGYRQHRAMQRDALIFFVGFLACCAGIAQLFTAFSLRIHGATMTLGHSKKDESC